MNHSLFQGNERLCGAPLSMACKQNSHPKYHLSDGVIALICSAFNIGLLLFVGIILVVRSNLFITQSSHANMKVEMVGTKKVEIKIKSFNLLSSGGDLPI